MADHVQAARAAFDRMRNSLVARGLLDREYRLTPAGNAYVDDLIAELRGAAGSQSSREPERWAA